MDTFHSSDGKNMVRKKNYAMGIKFYTKETEQNMFTKII
jgi:hypothetical protein